MVIKERETERERECEREGEGKRVGEIEGKDKINE